MEQDPLRQRAMSTSVSMNRQARAAIAGVASRLDPLLNRTIMIGAKARHLGPSVSRDALIEECAEIDRAIREARTELILNLMDAPAAIAGHSRVLDIEKSVDSLERALNEARKALLKH